MKLKTLFAPVFLFVWLFSVEASAQYEHVDARISQYPKHLTSSAQLASRIMQDFASDRERVRGAYTWIATNIAYDMNEYKLGNTIAYKYTSDADRVKKEAAFRKSLVSRTLRTRKGVCEGYASLMQDLLGHFGLESHIIAGVSRTNISQIGQLPKENDHVWNAVKIGGKWELIDVTWAAGSVDGASGKFRYAFTDAYFMPDPERFFMNHFPEDQRWLLVKKNPSEFARQPLFHPSYIRSDYNIDRIDGHLANNGPIDFSIGNLSSGDRVYYITNRQNTLQRVKSHSGRFTVPIDRNFAGTVTIFVNEKPMVSYKISRPNA